MISIGIEKTSVFINSVINYIKELPSKIWEWLKNTIDKISEFFSNAINTAKTKTGEFLSNVINVIKNLPNQIWTYLSSVIQKITSWSSDMVNKGKQAAVDLFNAVVNKVKEIPGQMLEIGKNIVSGIWNGISNSISWITSKVKEFAKGILDGIKSALGIHSPSKVFEQEVGKNMALGVGEGFTNTMNDVQKEMQKVIPTDFDSDFNVSTNKSSSGANNISSINLNQDILEKLNSILYFLQDYIPPLQNRQLCLDTGVLVGELTPPINKELAKIETSRERGR